jgi:transposase-like protein
VDEREDHADGAKQKLAAIEGKREILIIEPMCEECKATWAAALDRLNARGLLPVVSDAHSSGIQTSLKKLLLRAGWQRCKVHLMRNVMGRVQQKDKRLFAEKLKQICEQQERKCALRTAKILMEEHVRNTQMRLARSLTAWRTRRSLMSSQSFISGKLYRRMSWNRCFFKGDLKQATTGGANSGLRSN